MAEVQKQLEIKQSVERNCEELKLKMKEVLDFQREMKQTEKKVKQEKSDNKDVSVPVRSQMKREPEDDQHSLANVMKEKGNNCVKVKDFDQAILHYTSAIETFPDDAIYYTNRALCFLRIDRQNKCIEDCNMAISLDKQCVKAFYRRMQANESLGNTEAAIKDCEDVVRLEPSTLSHRRELDRLKNRLKNEKNITSRNEINNNRKRNEATRGVPGKPWSRLDRDAREVDFVEKKPHLRSKKPLKKIEVVENFTKPEPIPDHIVDKLFNNFTGEYDATSSSSSTISAFDSGISSMFSLFAPSTSQDVEDDVFEHLAKYNEQKRNQEATPAPSEEVVPKASEHDATYPFGSLSVLDSTISPSLDATETLWDAASDVVAKCNEDEQVQEVPTAKEEAAPQLPPKTKKVSEEERIPDLPATNVQFCSTWKDLTEETRCVYLDAIVAADSGVIKTLGPLLDSTLLSQLLTTLARHFIPNKLPVHIILSTLATNSEISILSCFMTTADRKVFAQLMEYMVEMKVENNVLSSIQRAFKEMA
uniref:RNA polymerase II-associated protein 3 n=1 Tax=Nyssomyia neivai TaxID=330878 RepID=A0A1L8DHS3_9DIPT